MALLAAYLPLIGCFFLKRNFMKLPSGWWLFLGQLLYLHQDNAFKAKSQTASEKQSKKQKKQALAVEKALRDMDNSDVVSARIMTADVVRLVYTGVDRKGSGAWAMCDDLDLMVTFLMIAIAIFVWHVLTHVLGGSGFVMQALLMPATTAGIAMLTMSKCARFGDSSALLQWLLAVVGSAAAFAVLILAPSRFMDFGLEAGATSLQEYFGAIAKIAAYRLEGSVREMEAPHIDPAWLAAAMALLSAFIAPAAAESAMRVCKAIHHATLSPYWMRAIKMPGMLAQAAMLMSLPLSLIVALGQVQPLVAYWGISRVQLALWWPVLVAVVALLQLLVARALVTTYLSLGLYQWHSIKHQNPPSQARAKAIDVQSSAIFRAACKVAIHFVGPAILLASLCMMLLTANGTVDQLPRYNVLPAYLSGNTTAGNSSSLLTNATSSSLLFTNDTAPTPSMAQPSADGVEVDGTILEGLSDTATPRAAAGKSLDAMLKRTLISAFATAKIPVPRDLIVFVATYLSWFTCTSWALSAYFFLFVYRNGMHL